MKVVSTALIVLLLLTVCGTGIASAGGAISVDIPETAAEVGLITTIPVTIHNAEDILGFKMYVFNNVSGVSVTVNSSLPLDALAGSTYDVNSDVSRDYQVVSWATSELHGISGDAVLFYVDVLPSADSPASLPVAVRLLEEMYDASYMEVSRDYPVDSGFLSVRGASGALVTKVPASAAARQTGTPVSTGMVETLPSVLSTNAESAAPTASPMPFAGVLAGFGLIILVRRKNI